MQAIFKGCPPAHCDGEAINSATVRAVSSYIVAASIVEVILTGRYGLVFVDYEREIRGTRVFVSVVRLFLLLDADLVITLPLRA